MKTSGSAKPVELLQSQSDLGLLDRFIFIFIIHSASHQVSRRAPYSVTDVLEALIEQQNLMKLV